MSILPVKNVCINNEVYEAPVPNGIPVENVANLKDTVINICKNGGVALVTTKNKEKWIVVGLVRVPDSRC